MSRTRLREAQLATTQHNAIKLNVGFLLKQHNGYSRDIDVAERRLEVAPDLILDGLTGRVRLTRTPPGIYVHGAFDAARTGECSRCLTSIPIHASIELSELYGSPPSDDAEFVVTEDGELDLAPLLRELVLLDEPAWVLCRPDCAGLCPVCGADRNAEPCHCAADDADPRLSMLGSLLDQAY